MDHKDIIAYEWNGGDLYVYITPECNAHDLVDFICTQRFDIDKENWYEERTTGGLRRLVLITEELYA